MAATALDLAHRMVEHWNTGNLERMVADCDPDIIVRPDPGMRVMEGIPQGVDATLGFIEAQREAMGLGHLNVLTEGDLGSWGWLRIRQDIESRSGVESEWAWTVVFTARSGKVVMIEFFVDDQAARAAINLS